MRCAACNVVVDPGRIKAGELRCVCGAELVLPGDDPPRGEVEPEPSPEGPGLTSYRSGPAPGAPRVPVVELENVGSVLTCPRCRETLTYAFHGSYDVYECRRCFGAFVDHKALSMFIDDARATGRSNVSVERQAGPAPGVPIESPAGCPWCKALMTRTWLGRRPWVLVDVCRLHGTWFDAGELAQVLSFEASDGTEPDTGDT